MLKKKEGEQANGTEDEGLLGSILGKTKKKQYPDKSLDVLHGALAQEPLVRFNSLNPKTRNRIHKDFILTQDGEQFVPEYVVQAISGIDKHFVPKADPWELNVLGDRRHTHPAYDGHIATESLRRRKWRGGLTARLAGKYRTPRK